MEYYVRASLIAEGYGFMGVEDIDFEADDLQEATDILNDKIDSIEAEGYDCVLVDEVYDEEGNEIKYHINDKKEYVLED